MAEGAEGAANQTIFVPVLHLLCCTSVSLLFVDCRTTQLRVAYTACYPRVLADLLRMYVHRVDETERVRGKL